MTVTLVTSAPSVIVAALRRINRYLGNPLDDSIWGRGARTHYLDENTFNGWIAQRDGWALDQLAEAHALDVLHDAYAIAELEHTYPNVFATATGKATWDGNDLVFTHADPFAHIDAMIHEEFPGAIPDAKLGKLRALAQERLDLKAEVESYKHTAEGYRDQLRDELDKGKALREQLEQPITDGKDPRIEGLMRRAAEVATAEEYCEVYDNIATQVGFPTRDELGMAKRIYAVTITRRMSLTPTEAASLSVADVTSNMRACSLDYEEAED